MKIVTLLVTATLTLSSLSMQRRYHIQPTDMYGKLTLHYSENPHEFNLLYSKNNTFTPGEFVICPGHCFSFVAVIKENCTGDLKEVYKVDYVTTFNHARRAHEFGKIININELITKLRN